MTLEKRGEIPRFDPRTPWHCTVTGAEILKVARITESLRIRQAPVAAPRSGVVKTRQIETTAAGTLVLTSVRASLRGQLFSRERMRVTRNNKIRILVVEDDPSVLQTVSLMLKGSGYDVATAADGFEALLQCQDQIPDLILSDLNMPAMSGFELLSVVRRRFPQVVAVATSGAYMSGSVPPGVIADAFYAKGREDAGKLLEIIAEALRSGPIGHDNKTAPVWIPRNGKDHNGVPFVVLTCTECLRSFPFTVKHEPTAELLRTPCIYCPHEVSYIIDFSRSVASPEKRAAWKAQFLKNQPSPGIPAQTKAEMSSDRDTLAMSTKRGQNLAGRSPNKIR